MIDVKLIECLGALYCLNYGLEITKKRYSWIRAFDVSFIQTIGVGFYWICLRYAP